MVYRPDRDGERRRNGPSGGLWRDPLGYRRRHGPEFDPDTVVGDTPNMGGVKNPTITQNTSFIAPDGAVFGDEDVPGMIAGNQSIGIAGIYTPTPPNQDTMSVNNNGLTAIPVDVSPNLTTTPTRIKEYQVSFTVDDEFTGFVNTAGTIITNSGRFRTSARPCRSGSRDRAT